MYGGAMYPPSPRRMLSGQCLALLGLVGFASLVQALPEDRDKPIQIEADSAELDQNAGVITYTGNVVVVQGTMRLVADTGKIFLVEGEFQRMEATGNPTTFRYQPDVDKEVIDGEGRRVEYNVETGLVTVTDNARFTQGQDEFNGDYIEYDLSTDIIRADSKDGGRIRLVIQPKTVQDN